MDNYFESTLDDVIRWELLDQIGDLDTVHEETETENNYGSQRSNTVSLQRDYVTLFGTHPKMEYRIYSSCCVCEQVFNPHVVSTHKEQCTGKGKNQSQQLKKKVKSKKKLSSVPPPPLFKNESPGPPVLSKFSDVASSPNARLTPDVLTIPELVKDPSPSTSVAPSTAPLTPPLSPLILPASVPLLEEVAASSTSRHKKSKKNNKTIKEHSGDSPCAEGQKSSCTRSLGCSNHKLRKSSGRSKSSSSPEKKSSKEKESRKRSPSRHLTIAIESSDYTFPVIKLEPLNCDVKFSSQEIPETVVKIAELPKNELHDEVESDDPSNQLESGYCSIETSLSTKSSPVLYYNPMSPLLVVTQFIQKENSVLVDTPPVHTSSNNGYFLTLPETSSSIKLYKSHPKPTILPTYGARKVGGAILNSHQRLEYQRNDIQMAITTKRMATTASNCKNATYSVPPPRSILLKPKVINKVNCKRASTDKISASESKEIKLSADVNGYILHTEMSEVAEAPQPNHCIQENINLLNMK